MKQKDVVLTFTIGIIIFLLIESFTNFTLYVNAIIFLHWKNLSVVLDWIIIYLVVIFGEIIVFSLHLIPKNYKCYFLMIIISSCRLISQFYFIGELYLLLLTVLFISILIFLTELLSLFGNLEFFSDYQTIMGGIMLGLGIHLTFLVPNISSNLTVELFKIPFTIGFCVFLLWANQILFKPNIINIRISEEIKEFRKTVSLPHFFLLGVLFFYAITWTFNPMGLSAYDSTVLNWFKFGFLYYIIIIMASLIISFFIIRFLLLKKETVIIKRIISIMNIAFCLINCLALIIIDKEFTIISTIYLTALTFINGFTFQLNLSYLFLRYSFRDNLKKMTGIIVFILSFGFSYAIEIIFTWTFYVSFLFNTLILSAIFFGVFIVLEIKQMIHLKIIREHIGNRNRLFGISFIIIFSVNLSSILIFTTIQDNHQSGSSHPTVMAWNIHNGIGLDGKFDLDRLIEEIKIYDPDVLGLNEVDLGVMKTSFVDITAYFAQKLGMYFYYGPTFFKHYGNAILSKYPFESVENIHLPVSEEVHSEPRGVIKAIVRINNEIWTFYVNHLATNEKHRIVQIPFIVNLMEQQEFERVVWMGDFNMRPDSVPYSLVNGSSSIKLIDSHDLLGVPGNTGGLDENANPSNRIDYIFCSPDLKPINGMVHCSIATDHCAVITQF